MYSYEYTNFCFSKENFFVNYLVDNFLKISKSKFKRVVLVLLTLCSKDILKKAQYYHRFPLTVILIQLYNDCVQIEPTIPIV